MPSLSPISVIYQDEHFLIVDKPADLLTVPGRGPDKQDCLINRVIRFYPNARIVHRLDMATSGLVLLAQSHAAQAAAGNLFADRQIDKRYVAVVDGQLKEAEGIIDAPLVCDWDNRPLQKVDYQHGKCARTEYSLLASNPITNTSSLELHPLTGRSHQLRVHLLSIGHPIVGDRFYATPALQQQSPRLLLHACKLTFVHPFHKVPIAVEAPIPFEL